MNPIDLFLARAGGNRVKATVAYVLLIAAAVSVSLAGIASLIIAYGKASGRL